MVALLTIFMLAYMVATGLFQTVYVWMYVGRLKQSRIEFDETSAVPDLPVDIILCLRGGDPSLIDCLSSLANLEYPDYRLHCVFDHADDPAISLVKSFSDQKRHSSLPIEFYWLEKPRLTGSLKCQAIVHVIEKLSDDRPIVTIVDADSVVDRHWLRDLVQPFSDPKVAAVSGNRWFTPQQGSVGSYLRQIWNAAAVVQMLLYNIPWGGSLALRRSALKQAGILEKWRTAFCEDTMLPRAFAEHDLDVVRVPNIIVNNTEATSYSGAREWIARQLLTARLYHPAWPLVLGHGLSILFCLLGSLAMIVTGFYTGHWFWAIVMISALFVFQLTNMALLTAISRANQKLLNRRLENSPFDSEPTAGSPISYAIALLASQFVQPLAALKAATTRRTTWRGIEYSIQRNRQVKLKEYVPYSQTDPGTGDETTDSIH